MRRFLCLLCLWVAAPFAQAADPVILVLGDSLSAAHNIPSDQGWVNLLAQRLATEAPTWKVVNASVSGATSANGKAALPALLEEYRPEILVLELGANDGLRGQPLAVLEDNLADMIEDARDAGAEVLLAGIELPVNYGPRYRDGLRQLYAGLAQRYQTGLVPFLLEGVALEPALMQSDGLHPVAAAQPRILENVWPALRELLP
ncbi:arylesterase [Kerstersia sp.]|uniref:arylesterase n=1 Tax=Kerstersia sp. TaxID=1930783 RepID=UPI003F911579